MKRLITKQDRADARKGWIGNRESNTYKDLEWVAEDDPRPTLTLWVGTSARPTANYYYNTIEQRNDAIAYYKKRSDEWEIRKAEQKKARQEASKKVLDHKLEKGNMFVTSWGYDQTNYDYIVVMEVSKTGKTVKCQRTSSLDHGQSCQSNLQEPIFCPFGDMFQMQVRDGYNGGVSLVGSYPFCCSGEGSRRKGYFSPVTEGQIYHETMVEFGH